MNAGSTFIVHGSSANLNAPSLSAAAGTFISIMMENGPGSSFVGAASYACTFRKQATAVISAAGGNEKDQFYLDATAIAGDSIAGGDGNDVMLPSTDGNFDLTMLAAFSGIEDVRFPPPATQRSF